MRRDEGAVSGDVTHDTDEIISLDRRRFLNMLGMAVLTVRCLHASAFDTGVWQQGTAAADDLIVHSGPGALSHRHDLVIPMAVIRRPPREGVRLTSTKALMHRHVVTLTSRDLTTVGAGGTVVQRASSHVFVIALAK